MAYILPECSEEQQVLVDAVNTHNVIGDAVAGSGKTTTILNIAKKYPEYKTLLLTYNKRLKVETRQKIKELGFTNIEAHSYHAFCCKYYKLCHDDTEIDRIINTNMKTKKPFNYDLIVIDEAQDIDQSYYRLICKIFRDNISKAKICILGDKFQTIYDSMKGADSRYLELAPDIFDVAEFPWKVCELSQSFRVTIPIANFVNSLFGYKRVTSKKAGVKPRYVICNTFSYPIKEVMAYLESYSPEDIYVLAPSLKSKKSPARKLENALVKNHVPVYVPSNDYEKLDEDIIKGKLVFSTFHQVKGLERKVVLVFNFDSDYFNYFAKDYPTNVCANTLYVAITRAKERLTVFHSKSSDYFEFIDREKLHDVCDVVIKGKLKVAHVGKSDTNYAVTRLVKYLPSHLMIKLLNMLTITDSKSSSEAKLLQTQDKKDDSFSEEKAKEVLSMKHKTVQGALHESVSDINGTAIPLYHAFKNNDDRVITDLRNSRHPMMKNHKADMVFDGTVSSILRIANAWNCQMGGYFGKLNQITDYSWMTKDVLEKGCARIENVLSKDAKSEILYSTKHKNVGIAGYIDSIDGDNIWEFKCVSSLSYEHYLQLAVYMFLQMKNGVDIEEKEYKLYNIVNNECKKIEASKDDLIEFMNILIDFKINSMNKIDDSIFLNRCKTASDKDNASEIDVGVGFEFKNFKSKTTKNKDIGITMEDLMAMGAD